MNTLTTQLTYRVPSGLLCNLETDPKKLCRFCVKDTLIYVCVLHNLPLNFDGKVLKTEACRRAVAGFDDRIDPEPDVTIKVDRKEVMKYAVTQYRKAYLKLIDEGYVDMLADKFAKESVLK